MDIGYVLVPYIQQVSLALVPVARITLIVRLSFDATYLYQFTFILLYNLLFTSLPVATLGGGFLRYCCTVFRRYSRLLVLPSFRPRYQRQGSHGVSSAIYPRNSGTGVYSDEILAVYARWPVSVRDRILYPIPCLDDWTSNLVEWQNNRVFGRLWNNSGRCGDCHSKYLRRNKHTLVSLLHPLSRTPV